MSTLWAGLRKNSCICHAHVQRFLGERSILSKHTHTLREMFSLPTTTRCISENAKKHFLSCYNERTQVSTTTKNSPSC